MLNQKVYIIEYEMVSPIALRVADLKQSIVDNKSADRPIENFSTDGIPFKNAAEVQGNLSQYYADESDKIKATCKTDRMLELLATSYGIAKNRLENLISLFDPEKTGVIMGVGADVTPFEKFEEKIISYISNEGNAIVELFTEINENQSKLNAIINPYDIYSIYLANKFKAAAFQRSVLTACTSSTQALAFGYDSIANGEVEVVIAGGTDSIVNTLATIAFGKLGVISETENNKSCKPFDRNRNGTLSGECAGFVVLASEDFVNKNNLKAKAELVGYGNTLDAYKITAPNPDGNSMTNAIKQALQNANITADKIDYINAHGTGTKHNDHLELKCIKRALGDKADTIPISSTKSRHGHAIAAAGIQEVCLVLEMMKNKIIPANLNLEYPCETDMNLITENKTATIQYAMTNNFAFGGVNTVLVLKNEMN